MHWTRSNYASWRPASLCILCFFVFCLFLKCFWGALYKSKILMTIRLKKLWVESSSLKLRAFNDKQLYWLATCLLAFFFFFMFYLFLKCFWGKPYKSKTLLWIRLKNLWAESSSLKLRALNEKQLCWLAPCFLAFFVLFSILLVLDVHLRSTI